MIKSEVLNDCILGDVGTRQSKRSASCWRSSPLSHPFHESPKSTILFAAQSRAYSNKKLTQNQASTSSVHTPRFCRSNPFEDISSLEFDKCSPGLLIIRQSSAEKKGEFKWSIDDISRIMPADIASPISVPEEHYDEEIESAAQQAIEKYFSFRHSITSPPDAVSESLKLSSEQSTPPPEVLMLRAAMACHSSSRKINQTIGGRGMISAISSTPCARATERKLIIKIDESSQTQLSLPPTLPPDLEAALRPYLLNKDENLDSEEFNISNTTLRRKLFFNKEDELSPVKTERVPSRNNCTTVPGNNCRPSRIEWTPEEKNDQDELYCLSSPDISPIKFKSSLEFPKEMSIDCSSISFNSIANDGAVQGQPSEKLVSSDIRTPVCESECHLHLRGIFSSTVQSSQIDRTDKDTGYSTMDVDGTPAKHQQLSNIKNQ